MHPTGVACEKSKVSHKSVGRKRESPLSYTYFGEISRAWRDARRGEERRGMTRWGGVRPGSKKEKLIAGTHAQHSIQIMEWLDRTTTFIFARVHRLPSGKAAYLDGINWRAGCVTSARPILIIKQPGTSGSRELFPSSLPTSPLALSPPPSRVHRLNREFNSRRMINYTCICGLSYFKKYISFNRVPSISPYGRGRPRMIASRFADLIFRGAQRRASDTRWW